MSCDSICKPASPQAPRPSSPHSIYKRRVEFAETDMAGQVHFANFFRYMEEAEHAMWREAGLSIAPPGEAGFPRVAAALDFHAPLRFEDVFDVHVRIEAIARRTIRYAHTITRDGVTIATGTMTAVAVRKDPDMRAIDIPEEIAQRFAVWRPTS